MNYLSKTITSALAITFLLFGMGVSAQVPVWEAPTAAFPDNNAIAPINVGTTTQTKAGDFVSDAEVWSNTSRSSLRYSTDSNNEGYCFGGFDPAISNYNPTLNGCITDWESLMFTLAGGLKNETLHYYGGEWVSNGLLKNDGKTVFIERKSNGIDLFKAKLLDTDLGLVVDDKGTVREDFSVNKYMAYFGDPNLQGGSLTSIGTGNVKIKNGGLNLSDSYAYIENGSLEVDGSVDFDGTFKYSGDQNNSGNSPLAGKILTSIDSDGNVEWRSGSLAQCEDGIDNDGDGDKDLADQDCSSETDNDESSSYTQCRDGIDNDGDGLIDWPADIKCSSVFDNDEGSGYLCSDGVDNDDDGLIDWQDDPGCLGNKYSNQEIDLSNVLPACSDGIDNDGDLLVDFPLDLECSSEFDNDESTSIVLSQCSDGIDNDSDGQVDFNGGNGDQNCASDGDNSEAKTFQPACADGIDNDGDGKIDFGTDEACYNKYDNDESLYGLQEGGPDETLRWDATQEDWVSNANILNTGINVSLGLDNIVTGDYALASGKQNTAAGFASVAFGAASEALGYGSFALNGGKASGNNSFASGPIDVIGYNSFGINLGNNSQTVTQPRVMSILGGNLGLGVADPTKTLDLSGGFRYRGSGGQNVAGNNSNPKVLTSTSASGNVEWRPKGFTDGDDTETLRWSASNYITTGNGWISSDLLTNDGETVRVSKAAFPVPSENLFEALLTSDSLNSQGQPVPDKGLSVLPTGYTFTTGLGNLGNTALVGDTLIVGDTEIWRSSDPNTGNLNVQGTGNFESKLTVEDGGLHVTATAGLIASFDGPGDVNIKSGQSTGSVNIGSGSVLGLPLNVNGNVYAIASPNTSPTGAVFADGQVVNCGTRTINNVPYSVQGGTGQLFDPTPDQVANNFAPEDFQDVCTQFPNQINAGSVIKASNTNNTCSVSNPNGVDTDCMTGPYVDGDGIGNGPSTVFELYAFPGLPTSVSGSTATVPYTYYLKTYSSIELQTEGSGGMFIGREAVIAEKTTTNRLQVRTDSEGNYPEYGDVLVNDYDGNLLWKNRNPTEHIVRVRTYAGDGTSTAIAFCPQGYTVIGGGGDCESEVKVSQPYPTSPEEVGVRVETNAINYTNSANENQGWLLECRTTSMTIYDDDAHAEAICMKNF